MAWLFAATVFISAFLLFQIQPMVGKYILPWFGSAPGVWSSSLMFFQLVLLAGYAYAHLLVSRLERRQQAILHGILLALALLVLPITPEEALKPIGTENPSVRILLILSLSVGAPFFLLAATAPLLQRWFAYLYPAQSPYRLYALSNFGSLLALLSYPFIIEGLIRLQTQTWIWSFGFVVFAVLCVACGLQLSRLQTGIKQNSRAKETQTAEGQQSKVSAKTNVGIHCILTWLSLSACGSGLLMAITNQMSIDIASVPFLWVLSLSLYLLTFILCFESSRWYFSPLFALLLPVALINSLRLLYGAEEMGIVDQVLGYSLTLFVCCMCCHGELARLRPDPERLTFFFLIVSLGGALGGMFVAILAPTIFSGFYEFHILLIASYMLMVYVQLNQLFGTRDVSVTNRILVLSGLCWATTLIIIVIGSYYSFLPTTWHINNLGAGIIANFTSWQSSMARALPISIGLLFLSLEIWRRMQGATAIDWWSSNRSAARLGVSAVLTLGLVSLVGALNWQIQSAGDRVIEQDRNFYGVLSLQGRGIGAQWNRLALNNGRIRHGEQHQLYKSWPTTYFGPETGIGVAIKNHPNRDNVNRQFRVGVVGLGAGTLATYANARINSGESNDSYVVPQERVNPDYFRFYELNPMVTQWARQHFTFLQDAHERGANIDVFEGDARIVMEQQIGLGEEQQFDVLAIDAFSSDAIPIHLLTIESMQIYLAHLNEEGILAFHVTNRNVDLIPIVVSLARAIGLEAIHIENYADASHFVDSTDWILLTSSETFLNNPAVYLDEEALPLPGPLWTDDSSSLFDAVRLAY
jgi:hypothetical protein